MVMPVRFRLSVTSLVVPPFCIAVFATNADGTTSTIRDAGSTPAGAGKRRRGSTARTRMHCFIDPRRRSVLPRVSGLAANATGTTWCRGFEPRQPQGCSSVGRANVPVPLSLSAGIACTHYRLTRRMPVELQNSKVAGSSPVHHRVVAQWQSTLHVSPLFVAVECRTLVLHAV